MPTVRQIRFALAKTSLRKPLVWSRHRGLTEHDAFVGAYPRSGSTWLRFMLVEILGGESSAFTTVNHAVPDVGYHRGTAAILPGAGRLIKTHEPYQREYKKAIYLVRDPRDVVLSEYAYQKALGLAGNDFDVYLGRFLRGEVNPFGSWIRHVSSWIEAMDAGKVNGVLVRFEDLRRDSENALAELIGFLGVPMNREKIREAVANNSLEKMKDKEKKNPQRASAKGRFVRSGSVGGWREQFTQAQIELVQERAGKVLERLGYPGVEALERELA
ncbi:MAG TPA: sulfotransferase domain-containing protein [Terriglobales bacterium]|nr:sulfotransferase domain-containing protein [Terriglobales bacterium]